MTPEDSHLDPPTKYLVRAGCEAEQLSSTSTLPRHRENDIIVEFPPDFPENERSRYLRYAHRYHPLIPYRKFRKAGVGIYVARSRSLIRDTTTLARFAIAFSGALMAFQLSILAVMGEATLHRSFASKAAIIDLEDPSASAAAYVYLNSESFAWPSDVSKESKADYEAYKAWQKKRIAE